jgi:hypothetical protein
MANGIDLDKLGLGALGIEPNLFGTPPKVEVPGATIPGVFGDPTIRPDLFPVDPTTIERIPGVSPPTLGAIGGVEETAPTQGGFLQGLLSALSDPNIQRFMGTALTGAIGGGGAKGGRNVRAFQESFESARAADLAREKLEAEKERLKRQEALSAISLATQLGTQARQLRAEERTIASGLREQEEATNTAYDAAIENAKKLFSQGYEVSARGFIGMVRDIPGATPDETTRRLETLKAMYGDRAPYAINEATGMLEPVPKGTEGDLLPDEIEYLTPEEFQDREGKILDVSGKKVTADKAKPIWVTNLKTGEPPVKVGSIPEEDRSKYTKPAPYNDTKVRSERIWGQTKAKREMQARQELVNNNPQLFDKAFSENPQAIQGYIATGQTGDPTLANLVRALERSEQEFPPMPQIEILNQQRTDIVSQRRAALNDLSTTEAQIAEVASGLPTAPLKKRANEIRNRLDRLESKLVENAEEQLRWLDLTSVIGRFREENVPEEEVEERLRVELKNGTEWFGGLEEKEQDTFIKEGKRHYLRRKMPIGSLGATSLDTMGLNAPDIAGVSQTARNRLVHPSDYLTDIDPEIKRVVEAIGYRA